MFLQNIPEDLRLIFSQVKDGPKNVTFDRIKCRILHRVSVRNVLDAISTTESEEIVGDLAGIDTTHSSIYESDDLALVK